MVIDSWNRKYYWDAFTVSEAPLTSDHRMLVVRCQLRAMVSTHPRHRHCVLDKCLQRLKGDHRLEGIAKEVGKEVDAIKERFEIDYDAKPTPHTTISKLSQINQKPNESVNEYLNRALKILLDLKRSIDPLAAVIPQFVAPAGIDIEAWTDLPEATRNII